MQCSNVFRDNFVADTRRKRENQYSNVWDYGAKHGGYRPVQSAFWLDIGRSHDADHRQFRNAAAEIHRRRPHATPAFALSSGNRIPVRRQAGRHNTNGGNYLER